MNEKIKKLILPVGLAIFAMTSSVLGFSGVLKQTTKSVAFCNWMKSLDDNTSLRDVNMPGSHDTMALYSIGDLAGQCQSLSLNDQLNVGVRFLDIRLKLDHNELKAVHGIVDEKASFKQIDEIVESFLAKNNSEFIIMSVKEEAKASNSSISFEDALKEYVNKDIYLKDTVLPNKVGDVRGKIILLSRYANSTIGLNAFDGWLDSQSFTLPNNDIYVQDTFKITSAEQKQNEIVSCFNESGHALKINFLSAYRTDSFPPSYAPSAAKDINPWINKEISKYDDRGIVLYDFVTSENMKVFFGGNK